MVRSCHQIHHFSWVLWVQINTQKKSRFRNSYRIQALGLDRARQIFSLAITCMYLLRCANMQDYGCTKSTSYSDCEPLTQLFVIQRSHALLNLHFTKQLNMRIKTCTWPLLWPQRDLKFLESSKTVILTTKVVRMPLVSGYNWACL